tara:strand:+ start:4185 stop:5063 length:879 start_codon:yes stop_codon:yes gene_type:complete
MTTHALRVPVSTGDTSKGVAIRDDLISGDNGGVLFCADLAFGYSYPAGSLPRPAPAAPASGAAIRDMTAKGNNAIAGTLGNVSYAGGGFDFTGIVTTETGIVIPGEVSTQLFTNQEFLFCSYFKLPPKVDWNPGPSIAGMIASTPLSTQTYTTQPEIFLLSQAGTAGQLDLRVQKAINSVLNVGISLPDGEGFYDDEVCQIAVWAQGGSGVFRIKNSTSTILASGSFTSNTADYSGNTIRVGGSPSGFGSIGNKTKNRVYRAFVEDLSVSGRDPVTVLNADFDRVIARGVFS